MSSSESVRKVPVELIALLVTDPNLSRAFRPGVEE